MRKLVVIYDRIANINKNKFSKKLFLFTIKNIHKYLIKTIETTNKIELFNSWI